MTHLNFSVVCDSTSWGENVAVVGSWNSWDTSRFSRLTTSSSLYPRWQARVAVPDSTRVEYKYVVVKRDNIVRWEVDGHVNRIFDTRSSRNDVFGDISSKPKSHHANHASAHSSSSHAHHATKWNSSGVSVGGHSSHDLSLDPLESAIVKLASEKRSWRQRLSFIRSLFTDVETARSVSFDKFSIRHLATVSIFLTFLSTGQVTCQEDGGHHRPNHHASEARQIESALASITSSVVSENSRPPSPTQAFIPFIIRKIYPHLPSYSSQFTVSVPLTRIRDIAHRGDIPHDLKQEIKHTLQNKLHRCAGPEDLHTSAALLNKINHGNYSHPFKEQFRIFHAELCAFFNASSLDDRLHYLKHNPNTKAVASQADKLLSLKHQHKPAIDQMQILVDLRQQIANLPLMQLSDSSDTDNLPSEDVQKTRLADIALEDYAFLLLGGVAKDIESQVVSHHFPWPYALSALALSFRSMHLSGIRPREAAANASELSALEKARSSGNFHRTKAAIDRAVRFLHNFSLHISEIYTGRVEALGKALGVNGHAISVFAEAEIRSNVAFQTSRIGDACSRRCREELSLPPWDPLFIGSATGKILFCDNLADLKLESDEDIIAICRDAQGDEDILPYVRGIVLGRSLPHLSHLGVRARQQGVVFVCAEERGAFEKVWAERGMKNVRLDVNAREGLALLSEYRKEVTVDEQADKQNGSHNQNLNVDFDRSVKVPIPLEKGTRAAISSKNWFAGRLITFAKESDGLFSAAMGVALPHGMFQSQVAMFAKQYKTLVSDYDKCFSANGNVEAASAKLRSFISENFRVDARAWKLISKHFQDGTQVMVRSSANAEDLEELSGAGLYDSIANVDVDNMKQMQDAISNVWASVWTKRAASSRSSYGIPHEKVSMAVLVHEMAQADMSFVAFSKDPVCQDNMVYIEVAVGMGETLASGAVDGSPYRFRVDRDTLDVSTVSFASFSDALIPGETGLHSQTIDYSAELMTENAEMQKKLVVRIAQSVLFIEKKVGGPQDIEGAISLSGDEPEIFVVQARAQIF